MDARYLRAWLHKWAMLLLLLGGINSLLIGLFDVDVITTLIGDGILRTVVYGLMGLSALSMITYRDTYLPFLGPTVIPCSLLPLRDPPGATREVRIQIEPHKKVMYWAAEPANESLKTVASWKDAYREYENAGVTVSNRNGIAVLKVRDPQAYRVPMRGLLEPHIHYRVCEESGWLGRIETVPVEGKKAIEGFMGGEYASLHQ